MQGNAGAILKAGMLRCVEAGIDQYLSIQMHDELVLCRVPRTSVDDVSAALRAAMLQGSRDLFPEMSVEVEIASGIYWGDGE